MPFVVYLLKASQSERSYKGWTCGGALVSPDVVITSAACVEDVKYLYVIAGYSKFVDADDIDTDTCTMKRKKKVTFICIPKAYEFEFTKIEQWAVPDIAVVKVESPYDFNDQSYTNDCSYTPSQIRVNYERKYQEPGVEAMVLGWGHLEKWRSKTEQQKHSNTFSVVFLSGGFSKSDFYIDSGRFYKNACILKNPIYSPNLPEIMVANQTKITDQTSHNVEQLHYASTTILDKSECKNAYKTENSTQGNQEFLRSIDKYMICTLEAGNIDDHGELVATSIPDLDGCITKLDKLKGANGTLCEGSQENPIESEDSEVGKLDQESREDVVELDEGKGEIVVLRRRKKVTATKSRRSLRRNGICQNDHGGPLVTWVGSHEVLIGVASVFKVINDTCAGPYLFTSTQCNGKFISCVLNTMMGNNTKLRSNCDGPASKRGFEMIERRISWIGHPDGPAENEIIETRPQVPISQYYARSGRS